MTSKRNKFVLIISIFFAQNMQSKEDSRLYTIEVLTGNKLRNLMPFVIMQRILTFSEYPYLYVGSFPQEMKDFESFSKASDSALAIAYHGETPVGLLTGCSFSHCASYLNDNLDVFKNENIYPNKCYYFPEIIIVPQHRGRGLSYRLLEALERHAKKMGYEKGSLITESHKNHPLKPDNYKPLDLFWFSRNYRKTPIDVQSAWHTYQPDGSVRYQKHKLDYWIKDLK